MGTNAPTIVTIPVRCASKKAPCPMCGQLGRRRRTLPPRKVRTVAYMTIAYLEITCGEYQARCDCCMTFRSTPEGVLPRAHYDNKVRDLVLARIIEDGLNIERTLRSLGRDFLLDLSTGFVYDRLRDRAAEPRSGGASPHGPGAFQRHPLRGRVAPWPFHVVHQASCRRAVIVRRPSLPGRARVGPGDGAVEPGEVPQDHGLSEQSGQPAGSDQ